MRDAVGWLVILASVGLGQNWEISPIFPEYLAIHDADIATDSFCLPHVAFGFSNLALEYASWTGDSWSIEYVDVSRTGFDIDLSLDRNDNPHIGYVSSEPKPEEVRYACRDGDSWRIETAAEGRGLKLGALALARDQTPHMVFVDSDTIRYAYKTADTWNVLTVPACPPDTLRRFFGVSLALDTSDRPGIAVDWWKPGGYDDSLWLSFFEYDGEDWHRFEVDSAGGWAPYEFSAPRVQSDPATDLFHIVYRSGAYATGKGGNWQVEETGCTDAKSRDFVLHQGQPHIVVCGCDCFMQYTWRSAAGWETEMVGDCLFTFFCPAKIAVDRTGRPHLTFDSAADGLLYYARRLFVGTEEQLPPVVQPKLQLLVRPNPAPRAFTLEFPVRSPATATIRLCDALGRTVWSEAEKVHPGQYCRRVCLSASISPGVYFLQVETNSQRSIEKVVLQ